MKLFKKNNYPKHLVEEDLTFFQQALIFIWEVFKVVIISLIIIIPVRYFLIKPFYVKGASMEPSFYNNEYLIIDEISYRFNEPKRGDTIVFHYPLDRSQYFIKRVIGLPGEKIQITAGQIYIFNEHNPEGRVLDETYLTPGMRTIGEFDVRLLDDEYYLLGDNRSASLDSRVFGQVKRDVIVGRTWIRGWPLSRISIVLTDFEYNL